MALNILVCSLLKSSARIVRRSHAALDGALSPVYLHVTLIPRGMVSILPTSLHIWRCSYQEEEDTHHTYIHCRYCVVTWKKRSRSNRKWGNWPDAYRTFDLRKIALYCSSCAFGQVLRSGAKNYCFNHLFGWLFNIYLEFPTIKVDFHGLNITGYKIWGFPKFFPKFPHFSLDFPTNPAYQANP